MEIINFINELEKISKNNVGIKLYPYNDKEKLYKRFLKRMFWLNDKSIITNGFLWELYKETNGIDLYNFYIVPFNNYFNKKDTAFDEYCRSWIVNQHNKNEIMADFYGFMTDGKICIGYLDNLRNNIGNNFIGIAERQNKIVTDIIIISSSINILLDNIMYQIKQNNQLTFSTDIELWKTKDIELDLYYRKGLIKEYKLKYLYDYESNNYKNTIK